MIGRTLYVDRITLVTFSLTAALATLVRTATMSYFLYHVRWLRH